MLGRVLEPRGLDPDLFGPREPESCGHDAPVRISGMSGAESKWHGLAWDGGSTTGAGEPVSRLHDAPGDVDAEVLIPGACRHTSLALPDALPSTNKPLIEVNLSNIYPGESFRQHSHVSFAADGMICGLGPRGYLIALDALAAILEEAG